MADSASIAALRREVWGRDLIKNIMDGLFFFNKSNSEGGLMGKGNNFVMTVKDDLNKVNGDTVTFGLTYKLSGAGVTGDSTLESNEEAITPYSQSVAIDQLRNAVRLTGKLDEKKNSYDMRKDAVEKLSIWNAETLEQILFMHLAGIDQTDLTDVNGTTYSARAGFSNTPNLVPAADEAAGTV